MRYRTERGVQGAFYLACVNIPGIVAFATLIPIAGLLAYDVMNSSGKGIQEGSSKQRCGIIDGGAGNGASYGGGRQGKSGQ